MKKITKKAIVKNIKETSVLQRSLTREQFRNSSKRKFASSTIEGVFKSWNRAKKAAKIA